MLLFGPLTFLCLLEGIGMVWEKKQADGYFAWELVASRRIKLVRYRQGETGYTLMKPGEQYTWQGIPVTINNAGLRDDPVSLEKQPGTIRILNLGDSVAMGWGVWKEETYGDLLEKALNQAAKNGTKYEVINAAVPGWNQENIYAYLAAEGLKYQPDLILIDLTIVNDIYGASAIAAPDRPLLIEWLRSNTYFWPFLTLQIRAIQANAQDNGRIAVLNPPKDAASYFPLDPADPAWDSSWKYIQRSFQAAKAKDIPFILLQFPVEHQVIDPKFPTTPQQVFSNHAGKIGMLTIDLLPAFQIACSEKPGGKCQLEDHYLFADLWMHPSKLGNEITAAQVLQRIESDMLLSGN